MHTDFSLHRIRLLLKADWIEHRKSFLFGMGGLLIIWLFILFIIKIKTQDIAPQAACFIIGGLITFIYFCRHAGRKVHTSMNIYYTLPASSLEKYTTLLLEGAMYFVTYIILFYAGLLLWKLIHPEALLLSLPKTFTTNGTESGVLLFTALIFLSYMTFKKHAFLIAITGIAAFLGLLLGVFVRLMVKIADIYKNYFNSSFLFDTFDFMASWFAPVMLFSTLVVMYVAYLKLKEKELR